MKVGDYVRTKRGLIARILKFNSTGSITCDRNIYWGVGNYNSKKVLCDLTQIIKSAEGTPKGLLSLIEVGDYVNGILITIRMIDNIGMYFNEIKSIVTKEQFESMEYRL